MKRIATSKLKFCPPVFFCSEDIKDVVELLEHEGFHDFTFKVNNAEYDLDEFKSLEVAKISKLNISSHKPFHVSIEIAPRVVIYTDNDFSLARGLRSLLEEMFLKNKPISYLLVRFIFLFAFSFFVFIILAVCIDFLIQAELYLALQSLLLLAPVYIFFDYFGLDSFLVKSKVSLEKRRNFPGFFQRNKDAILNGLLIAALIAVVKLVWGHYNS